MSEHKSPSQYEMESYDKLLKLVMPVTLLEKYRYPVEDPSAPGQRKIPAGASQMQLVRGQFNRTYECDRCRKSFSVDQTTGLSVPAYGPCRYHKSKFEFEKRYSTEYVQGKWTCCGSAVRSTVGCTSNPNHVQTGELHFDNYFGYFRAPDKPYLEPNRHGVYALDCEMCYTTHGMNLTRVTVIDLNENVVYDKLVRPENDVIDYNTHYSGISEYDLRQATTRLSDVQRDFQSMFSSKTILVGHGLDNDTKSLRMFHEYFIDTSQVFPHYRGLPLKRSLKMLALDHLAMRIQTSGSGHDSKEDAVAALRLAKMKAGIY